MERFEIIEHTADVRVRVYGENIEELFKNAAYALFSLITNYEVEENKEKKINLEADTLEDLLVNWLNELISIFFAYKFLPKSYNVSIKEGAPNMLESSIRGGDFSPYEKKIDLEIKAATYHNLKIERDKDILKAEIIFDV